MSAGCEKEWFNVEKAKKGVFRPRGSHREDNAAARAQRDKAVAVS